MFSTDEIRRLIEENRTDIFYNSKAWRRLSHKIIREHHKECRICRDEKRLTRATLAHHIKPLRTHPELAYEPSNLMPLCHDCHERIHGRSADTKPKGYTNEEKW